MKMFKNRELYFVIVVTIATLGLLFLPTGYDNSALTQRLLYEKAEVVAVDNDELSQISVVVLGSQELTLKFLSGRFKGDTIASRNMLLGDKRRDKLFELGDRVLSVSRLDESGKEIVECRAEELYRQDIALILLIAFVVVLVIFAGWTGAKAALSFIFTALVFWKLLLPALLSGYSPLWVSIGVVFVATSAIILLVGGISKRGVVALVGAMSGVIVTAMLALLFGYFFKVPGSIQEYSEALMFAGFAHLDFSEIFLSSIFISSAGAVMDVAMDIAAAQDELSVQAPHLSVGELVRSGLNIASPVVGSMTTTLLFAYSGSFMFAFMAFMAQGVPIANLVNRGFIAAEILHTLVGSFGLVLVAPITALIGGYIFGGRNK